MINKYFKRFFALAVCILAILSVAGCGGSFDVKLGIGDGNKENDAVNCHYVIADSFSDNYVIKGWFDAEAEADLTGRFVFSISLDERFSSVFRENVLFEFDGTQLTEAKNGKLKFEINLGKLSDIFEKTDSPKTVAFHFHRKTANNTDMTTWNESAYTYTFNGKTVKLYK